MAGGTVFHIPFQTAIHSRPTAAVLALLAPLKALKEHGAALKQDADAYRQHRMLMDLCRRERDTEDQHGSSFQPTCVWEQCLEALTARWVRRWVARGDRSKSLPSVAMHCTRGWWGPVR